MSRQKSSFLVKRKIYYKLLITKRIHLLYIINLLNGNLTLKKSNLYFTKWLKYYNLRNNVAIKRLFEHNCRYDFLPFSTTNSKRNYYSSNLYQFYSSNLYQLYQFSDLYHSSFACDSGTASTFACDSPTASSCTFACDSGTASTFASPTASTLDLFCSSSSFITLDTWNECDARLNKVKTYYNPTRRNTEASLAFGNIKQKLTHQRAITIEEKNQKWYEKKI
jgi:hypothetical protein